MFMLYNAFLVSTLFAIGLGEKTTAIFFAKYIICSNRKHVPGSEFGLRVFPVRADRLDINCADEIHKFGCHVSWFVKINVIFFKVFCR